ncbi:MAG: hypothetical protein ACFFCQ_13105 [Promethearchaeota archaeon]
MFSELLSEENLKLIEKDDYVDLKSLDDLFKIVTDKYVQFVLIEASTPISDPTRLKNNRNILAEACNDVNRFYFWTYERNNKPHNLSMQMNQMRILTNMIVDELRLIEQRLLMFDQLKVAQKTLDGSTKAFRIAVIGLIISFLSVITSIIFSLIS